MIKKIGAVSIRHKAVSIDQIEHIIDIILCQFVSAVDFESLVCKIGVPIIHFVKMTYRRDGIRIRQTD